MGDGGPLSPPPGAARRRAYAALSIVFAATLFAFTYAPALDPATRLAPRDFAQFHLPLYASFVRWAGRGLPEWNPDVWGGQPVLSNPNYAPFYPPTWLIFWRDPAWGFQVGFALHGLFAALGAALLVARLGGRSSARWLAAIAFGAGSWSLALLHAGRAWFGLSWLPWILVAARALESAAPGPARSRAGLGLAGALAGLALAGEPVTLLVGAGAAALVLLASERASAAVRWRGALAAGLGLALAALALVPAYARLRQTVRGPGLLFEKATEWSLPPQRLIETVFPRFFGDPARTEEGLFFGWTINDRQYPYLMAISAGALLTAWGLAALLGRRAIPWRRVWLGGALAGLFLALGRHNPLFGLCWSYLPGLSAVRYPEKFLLATLACLVFAGALAWGRALDEREEGRPGESDLPGALAAVATGVAALFALSLTLEPRLASWFVSTLAPLPPGSPLAESAARYLTGQAWIAVALWAAATAVSFSLRFRRLPAAACAALAVALVAGEQGYLGQRLLYPVPAAAYLEPPPLALEARALPGRIWSNADVAPWADVWVNRDRREQEVVRTRLERLDGAVGVIWGEPTALSRDYDLSLTAPARRAIAMLDRLWQQEDRDLAYRLLGAWSVGKLALVKDRARVARELAASPERPRLAELVADPYWLPLARFVGEAEGFPAAADAERAALAARLPLAQREFLIGAPGGGSVVRFDPFAEVLATEQRGDEMTVRYRATLPALLVVAATFDAGWSAAVGGETLAIFETASGMMAIVLPPGTAAVELAYRDPWVRVGAGVSAVALLVAALAGLEAARRARAARP